MSDQPAPKASTDRLRDPADSSSDNLEPVELLADDFMRRQRAGQNPTIEEYCTQHPELAAEIREVFPALVVIERVAPDSADLDESARTLRSPDDQPIDSIGDYRILREIGRGGMGVVYEAEQESLGRRVALKVLPRQVASDEKALLRFQREARAAAKMHHTNIVPVFEVGRDKEFSFYAMQLIQGQGLDHVIGDLRELRSQVTGKPRNKNRSPQNGIEKSLAASLIDGHFEQQNLFDSADVPGGQQAVEGIGSKEVALTETVIQSAGSTMSASLPGQSEVSTAENNRAAYFGSVAEIGLQASRALGYAHARGITHRDIKPSNLILDTGGIVWITDFGLARIGDSSMTQTGDVLGTIRYMSPERFKGQCDNRADVYSLGLTLYEMLVLKPAFESPDRLQLIDIVTKTEVVTPRSIDSRVPRDLETIVLKACDKDPKRRYQSADDMADDLQRFVSDEPILARRASAVERVARWSRRNPWLATAISVSVVALIAIAGISIAAAQTQSTLNNQLTNANQALNEKTEEQRKTNQDLVDSNKSKEELIRDLKSSQSRLAEKQAEFVAEKGDIAESMLWLGRSYEHADKNDAATRNRVLFQLSQSAKQMPRLIREIAVDSRVDELSLLQHVNRVRYPNTSEEAEIVETARQFSSFRELFGGDQWGSRSTNILAFRTHAIDAKGVRRDAIRCYDARTRQWTGRVLTCEGVQVSHDFNETKRWLATISYEATALKNEESDTKDGDRIIQVTESTLVRNIDSGEVIYESHSDYSGPQDGDFMRSTVAAANTRIFIQADGGSLIRLSPGRDVNPNRSVLDYNFDVNRIAIPSGDVSKRTVSSSQIASRMVPLRYAILSGDGTRLFVLSSQRTKILRGIGQSSQLLCFDVDHNKQIGQPIQFDDGQPMPLSGKGDRVAVIRVDGNRRRIQIHDVESGEQVGESVDLNVPTSIGVRMQHFSRTGNRLVVSFLPKATARSDSKSPVKRGWVQVFDLTLRTPVTPPLPTFGVVSEAVLTTGERIVVRDAQQVRIWKMRGGNVSRTLVAGAGDGRSYLQIQASDGDRLLTTTGIGDIDVTTWNGATGRSVAQTKIRAVSHAARAIDPSGKFVITASGPSSRGDSELVVQSWRIEDASRIGRSIRLLEGCSPAALGSRGRELAVVVQPGRGVHRSQEPGVRVLNLETEVFRDVPKPRQTFMPDFVTFDRHGTRLFVISGSITTLDVFDLTQNSIKHVDSYELDQFRKARPTLSNFTFFNESLAVSQDGRLVAGYTEDGSLQVQDVNSGNTVHTVLLVAERAGLLSAQPTMSFSPNADSIYFSRAGGLVFRSNLTGLWGGSSAEVSSRLRMVTGLEFGEDDAIQIASLAEASPWTIEDFRSNESLDKRESQAIERFRNQEWDIANTELKAWSQRRPDDWIPLALRILPLVQVSQFDEADQVSEMFVGTVGRSTASKWLNYLDEVRATQLGGRNATAVKELSAEEFQKAMWFQSHRLEVTSTDTERAVLLFETAQAQETQFDLKRAADSIDEASRREPRSADIHYYRAHLMERLNRWPEALESRRAVLRLDPDRKLSHFRVVVGHLIAGNDEQFRKSWADHLSSSEEIQAGEARSELSDRIGVNGIRDTIAKPRLVAGGPMDEGMKRALHLADDNFNSPEAMNSKGKDWHLLCKGIAEYRRGEKRNLKAAIEHLDAAYDGFIRTGGGYSRGEAITRFFAAMVRHELDNEEAATSAYLDGLDRLRRDQHELLSSNSATWHEWQLAEVARREAEELLKIDINSIDPVPDDTSAWVVLFEDSFDNGISDQWQQIDGEWNTVDGAACGTLTQSRSANEAYGRLETEIPDLPSTFEVEYETSTSAPMLAACFLRLPSDGPAPIGLRVALASYPDRIVTHLGKSGTGINLLTHAPFGFWVNQSDPEFKVQANEKYKVRIIRQPQRITVYVDGEPILSDRVRNIETRSIRFFARGEEGMKMFVDNFRIRTSPMIPRPDKNNE